MITSFWFVFHVLALLESLIYCSQINWFGKAVISLTSSDCMPNFSCMGKCGKVQSAFRLWNSILFQNRVKKSGLEVLWSNFIICWLFCIGNIRYSTALEQCTLTLFFVIKAFYASEAHLNSAYVKQKSMNFLFKFIQIGNSKTCYEILLLKNCSEEWTLQWNSWCKQSL